MSLVMRVAFLAPRLDGETSPFPCSGAPLISAVGPTVDASGKGYEGRTHTNI